MKPFMKIIGLIRILNQEAFEIYRSQVGQTVSLYQGSVAFRGRCEFIPWNELGINDFDSFVEVIFPNQEYAEQWARSPEYAALLPIRAKAMLLTLFGVNN
jgi:uncharacterized protein (DUF1330 family)